MLLETVDSDAIMEGGGDKMSLCVCVCKRSRSELSSQLVFAVT